MVLEVFLAPEFQDISLNKWLRALPQQAAITHTNLKKEDLERIPTDGNPVIHRNRRADEVGQFWEARPQSP